MNVLVTYGGTKVPIDDVRDITNKSKGDFGSRIVTCLTDKFVTIPKIIASSGLSNVACLRAVESREPSSPIRGYIDEHLFTTFEDYALQMERLLTTKRFDVVFLAAAVSDFTVEKQPGKIASNVPVTISLIPTPKIIKYVKKWSPGIKQVGFKLLKGVSENELISVAMKAGEECGSEVTIANDLEWITKHSHPVYVCDVKKGTHRRFETGTENVVGRHRENTMKMLEYVFECLGLDF
jgi:phosphopantothenoylcysteine synthetase/decarboxylase